MSYHIVNLVPDNVQVRVQRQCGIPGTLVRGPCLVRSKSLVTRHVSRPTIDSAFPALQRDHHAFTTTLRTYRNSVPSTAAHQHARWMPCAAEEQCLTPARTPKLPDGHKCYTGAEWKPKPCRQWLVAQADLTAESAQGVPCGPKAPGWRRSQKRPTP